MRTAFYLANAAALTISLAGFSGAGPVSRVGSETGAAAVLNSEDASSAEEESVSESDSGSDIEVTLPLTDEKKELSVWLTWTNEKTSDPNDLEGVQYLEELTNVHINWIPVSAADAAEKYQLMQASDDLPDIVVSVTASEEAAEQAISDGWAIDMSGLIESDMPVYKAFLESHDTERRFLSSADGVVRCAANIAGDDSGYKGELQWCGLAVRSDLIEKAGYTGSLETIEDYHQMLLTCKQNLENLTAPLYVSSGGYGITGAFLSAYGVTNSVMEKDGTVSFGPAQEGYGQWLDEMRTWYSEGLIDPNFDSVSGLDVYRAPASVVGADQSVCFTTIFSNAGTLMPLIQGTISDPSAVITPVVNPVLNSGDEPKLINVGTGSGGNSVTGCVMITTDCEDPELAARWLDFMLTRQAMVAGQYGREGVSYEIDSADDAPYRYVYKEGYQTEDERTQKLGTPGVGYYNWSCGTQNSEAQMAELSAAYAAQGINLPDTYQDLLDAKELWDSQGNIDCMYQIPLTSEESSSIATVKTDIDTRVAEYTVQYIKGQTDESFADFCQELEDMQVQSVVDVYQTAYDRYMSK
ncbi:MAG: extracellular solute-binding protein [Lachnospiraceae bacterium]|jgi:putative aldouronate transport system substrate-binding protein